MTLLEVEIQPETNGSYAIALRLPQAATLAAELVDCRAARIDAAQLRALSLDAAAYGRALTGMVFAEPALREAWAKAQGFAAARGEPLRVALKLGADDALHELRWEALCDPTTQEPLALSERILVSRVLPSADLAPLTIPEKPSSLRALAVAANPIDLADFGLPPIAVADEIERISAALSPIPTTIIADCPQAGQRRATLAAMLAALRDGADIFYLVCHSTLRDGWPFLWLEGDDGRCARVRADELASCLRNLSRRPLLAVLASCFGVGDQADSALMALGPQLAQAGIPAVLALRDRAPMALVERLMPNFFRELRRDGQVDRALAAARAALRDTGTWWQAVLFLRIADGRLWRDSPAGATALPAVLFLRIADGRLWRDLPASATASPDQRLQRYLERLRQELAETEVVPMRNLFEVASTRDYAPLLARASGINGATATPEPVLAALNTDNGLLALGDAGSGKSHTLRYAALTMAQAWPDVAPELRADLGWSADRPWLPVYVQLQDLPRCRAELRQRDPQSEPPLLALIDHHLRRMFSDPAQWPPGSLADLMATTPCLLLLDGLDEIDDDALRRDAQEWAKRFLGEHPQHRIVIASRPWPQFQFVGKTIARRMLQPLQPDQMRRILIYWQRAALGDAPSNAELEDLADNLLNRILDDPDLKPLAVRPLFLTTMARMALSEMGLPAAKTRKYARMVDCLIEWRRNRLRAADERSLFADQSHRAGIEYLARFAACVLFCQRQVLTVDAFTRGCCAEQLPQADFEYTIEANAADRLFRSVARHTGLLVERDGGYQFVFGFGNYLAARFCIRLRDMAPTLLARRADPAWRETIIMTVGLLNDNLANINNARPLLEALNSGGAEDVELAAAILEEVMADGGVGELMPSARATLRRARELKLGAELINRLERLVRKGYDTRNG